jgi:hypothetical protein
MGESLGMRTSPEQRNTAAGVRVRPCPRLQLPLKHGYPYYSSCPAAALFPAYGLFLEQCVDVAKTVGASDSVLVNNSSAQNMHE